MLVRPLHSIEKRSLGNQIANILRVEILFGRLAEGTQLSQDQICMEFGTSRMPARDALRQLIAEGYVKESGTGRLTVAKIDREDILDTLNLEATLCGLIAYRAAERATDKEIVHIIACHERMREEAKADNWAAAAKANADFHRSINLACHSPRLIATLRSISVRIVGDARRFNSHIRKTIAHHDLLIKALKERKPKAAQEVAVLHALTFAAELANHIAEEKKTQTPGQQVRPIGNPRQLGANR